ncbi:MAG: CocE/NonD family hydrolase [Taibaiella sp.]|nr:CocE/NonD family hydrolase [Taibaiella sp.]
MKSFLLSLLLLPLFIPGFTQPIHKHLAHLANGNKKQLSVPLQTDPALLDSAWIVTHYTKKEVYITMRDGVRLFTAIYAPKDLSQKHPVLLNRTPYSIAPYGEGNFRLFWRWSSGSSHAWMQYFRDNYIMVIQDVLGKYMSEGDFENIRPFHPNKKGRETDEASDAYDTIDWLVNNVPGNNGRVGCFGISYPGFYATMAAMSGHPALKAASPQAPVTDWYHGDDVHHNGAFMLMDNFSFHAFNLPRRELTQHSPAGFKTNIKDNYKFYLQAGTMSQIASLIKDSVIYWQELYQHPDYDQYWKERNVCNYVKYIPDSVAMLVVGGYYDAEDCYGALHLYKSLRDNRNLIETPNLDRRLVMGPWYHGQWARDSGSYLGNIRYGQNTSYQYQTRFEKPFFDLHLKTSVDSNKNGICYTAQFFTGSNKWKVRTGPEMLRMNNNKYFLQNIDSLAIIPSTSINSSNNYISDPAHPVPYTAAVHDHRTREYMNDDQRFAERRPDVLTYKSGILTEDQIAWSPIDVDLFVSLSTTDADLVVKVIDVFPDDFSYDEHIYGKGNGKDYPMGGYEMLVRGDVMRGRYRNSFSHPQPFTPGEITEVKFTLNDIAHTFKKGHRIMVQIQSSWFPLVDRNPQQFVNIYTATPDDFIKCKVRVYHDARHPSSITMYTIRDSDKFFEN